MPRVPHRARTHIIARLNVGGEPVGARVKAQINQRPRSIAATTSRRLVIPRDGVGTGQIGRAGRRAPDEKGCSRATGHCIRRQAGCPEDYGINY